MIAGIVAVASVLVSVHLRWRLADLADWGLDEAATVWLAAMRLRGGSLALGLVSSREIPNMSGAPLLTLPLTLLDSPLAISRALSLTHLAAVIVFGHTLVRRGASALAVYPVLLLMPSLLLISSSVWNQYYLVALSAVQLSLLLLWAGDAGPRGVRRWSAAGYLSVGVLMPTVHLIGFTDLAASVLVYVAVLARSPTARRSTAPLAVLVAVFLALAVEFYVQWFRWLIDHVGVMRMAAVVLGGCAVFGGAIATAWWKGADLTERAIRSDRMARVLVGCLCLFVAEAAVLSFFGVQIGRRLLLFSRPPGWLLLVGQILLVASAVPVLTRMLSEVRERTSAGELFNRTFTNPQCAAVLMAHLAVVSLLRFALVPTLLIGARPDLLESLIPGLLGLILLMRMRGSARPAASLYRGTFTMAGAVVVVAAGYWLASSGLDGVVQTRYPLFVPPSEMTSVADRVADLHAAAGGGEVVDVTYDLSRGLDWVARTCGPEWPWYTVGRQYDWLLLSRHGLRNAHEGSCDRSGAGEWQVGYRGSPMPPGMRTEQQFPHVEIRRRIG